MTTKNKKHVLQFFQQNRFALLLIGLMLLFFYGAIIAVFSPTVQSAAIRIALGFLLPYLVVAAAFVAASDGKLSATLVVLAFLSVATEIADVALLRDETQVLSHTFGMLFIAYVIFHLMKFIFMSRQVTADTIFASLCAYLLLATFWMFAYSLLELFEPASFAYSLIDDPDQKIMRLGAEPAGIEFYFSLVTMTTLGYGDIVPTSTAARSMATLQAVIGQFYLTVLVARLVGLHVAVSAIQTK